MNLFRGRNIYILFLSNIRGFEILEILTCLTFPKRLSVLLNPFNIFNPLTWQSTAWQDHGVSLDVPRFSFCCLMFFFFLNHYYSSMWFQPQVKCVQLQGPSGAVQLNVYNKAGWWNGKSLCIGVTCHIQLTATLYRLLRLGGDPKRCQDIVQN